MAQQSLKMPRLGETMETGRLVAWLKSPGEDFVRGDTIAEVETDKTVVELPALSDGTMVEHLAAPGDEVVVGDAIATIEGEAIATVEGEAIADDVPPITEAPASIDPEPPRVPAQTPNSPQRATPAARHLARSTGVDLNHLTGTGRRGRVEVSDVSRAGDRCAPPERSQKISDGPQWLQQPSGQLAYDVYGVPDVPNAPGTMLLLHGFSGSRLSFAGFAPILSATRRVVVPDLPAHGATTIEAHSADEMHHALLPVLQAQNIAPENLQIVGLSMGAIVATRLAKALVAAGTPPSALSLIAPAGLGTACNVPFVESMAAGPSLGELLHLLRKTCLRLPDLSTEVLQATVDELAAGRLRQVAGNLCSAHGQKIDIVADLARLSDLVPIQIAVGHHDEIVPWPDVWNAPPQCAVHLFKNAGHMIHWDTPNDLAAVLLTAPARRP